MKKLLIITLLFSGIAMNAGIFLESTQQRQEEQPEEERFEDLIVVE